MKFHDSQRLRARGKAKAQVALGNTQLKVYYALLSRPGTRHDDLGPGYYQRQRDIRRQIAHHVGQAWRPRLPSHPLPHPPDPTRQGQQAPRPPDTDPTAPAGQMSRQRRRCRAPSWGSIFRVRRECVGSKQRSVTLRSRARDRRRLKPGGLYDSAAGCCRCCAVAKIPRTWVPLASRQVADRHGCPASPAAAAPSPGWRILLSRMMSWPFRMSRVSAVSTRRSVANRRLAATDPVAFREPSVTGWLVTVGSGVLLTLCACASASPWIRATN